MKIILLISIVLLFFGCGNINNVTKNPQLVNLVVQQDKYSLIFKHQFYNNFETFNKNLAKFGKPCHISSSGGANSAASGHQQTRKSPSSLIIVGYHEAMPSRTSRWLNHENARIETQLSHVFASTGYTRVRNRYHYSS